MFIPLFVCLLPGYLKMYCTDFMKIGEKVGHRPRTSPLNFG